MTNPFAFVEDLDPEVEVEGFVPVALGGDLATDLLLSAYQYGVVAMAADSPNDLAENRANFGADVERGSIVVLPGTGDPYAVTWWFPRPRFALDVHQLKFMRDALQSARKSGWQVSFDQAFDDVVLGCAENRRWRWMSPTYQERMTGLHGRGLAHSVEIWEGPRLVGGAFGVISGTVFVGESVFSRESNAGKAAIAGLARHLRESGGTHLDWQYRNALGQSTGARAMDLRTYLPHFRTASVTFEPRERLAEGWLGEAIDHPRQVRAGLQDARA